MAPYTIYTISSYSSMSYSKFDSNKMEFETLEDIIEQLTVVNKGYHFRIDPNKTYIFYGDLDHYPNTIETFFNILQKYLNDHYNLQLTFADFKYTQNSEKQGSFHYSIPKFNATAKKLHEILTNLKNDNPNIFTFNGEKKKQDFIDTSIYNKHWFRCPNQSKGIDSKSAIHKIVTGTMCDFIIDYIPTDSINIENATYQQQLLNIPIIAEENNKPPSITKLKRTYNKKKISPPTPNQHPTTTTTIPDDIELSNMFKTKDLYIRIFDECFTQERFENYEYWINVGMALKNTFEYKEGLELFDYFSKKGKNYTTFEDTKYKFDSFDINFNGFTIATIYYYAIQDNKEKLIKILTNNTLSFNATDICKYIKLIAGHKFIYKITTFNGKTEYKLYCYNGKYWENDDILFRSFISNELLDFLKNILTNVYWHLPSRDFASYKSKLDRLTSLSFKREIIETYKEYGSDYNIKFDEKWWLFGFNNLVYDMKEGSFRDYKSDDYISITCGYDWIEPSNEHISTVKNLINQIIPVATERETFLQIISTAIDGRPLEKFNVFNGCGRNGKGLINDLLLCMLGPYGIIGNSSLLFEIGKTGCSQEKANLDKKRYVVFREPPEKMKFQNSVIKELTGGGKISARGLYDVHTEKDLFATIICECNTKPDFAENPTQADLDRLVDILFRSHFTANEAELDETNYIFRQNPFYKTKEFQDTHKCALFKTLTEEHKKFIDGGSVLKIASSIVERSKQYLVKSNDFMVWFLENYSPSPREHIKLNIIYSKLLHSEYYLGLSKKDKDKYKKQSFFDFIKSSIFFRKYYIERHEGDYNFLKGWKAIEGENESYELDF